MAILLNHALMILQCFTLLYIFNILVLFYHSRFLYCIIEMGAQVEKPQHLDLSEHAPPLEQYQLKHCGPNYYVWDHCMQQDSLIQFPVNIPNQIVLKQHIEMYLLRHRHHLLVSSMFFRRNQSTGKASVFYERVFTNLSRIKDIPFQDSLQFYYVALKGFELLYKRYGFFEIEQNMFHITKNNKVKVWCNKDISKIKPKQLQPGMQKGKQSDMVRKIIRIIQQNSDASGTHYPIGPSIYQQASSGFAAAIQKLRNICRQQLFTIPQKLTCLDIICKGDVGILLDQYGQIKENPNFFDVNENQQIQPLDFDQKDQNHVKIQQNIRHQPQPLLASFEPKIGHYTTIHNLYSLNDNSLSKIRKPKGLKISHSLQKQHSQQISRMNVANQYTKDTLPIQSPIKNLTCQIPTGNFHHISTPSFIPYRNQIPVYHQNYLPQQKVMTPQLISQPPQNYFTNVFSHPIAQERRSPIINRPHSMIRSNSVDILNRSNETPMNKSRQYQVVVNYAQRQEQGRPLSRPNYPPAPQQSQQYNSNTISKNQVNNFLNIFPPTPQRVAQMQNFKTTPSFYKKEQKPYQFKSMAPTQMSSNQKYNRISFETSNYLNENKQNKQFEPQGTIINHLLELKNQKSQKQQAPPLTDYTNFKARFEQYKKNFDYKNYQSKNQTDLFQSPVIKSFQKGHGQSYGQQNTYQLNKKDAKPFFTGILQNETVTSYMGTNQFGTNQKKSEPKLERVQSYKSRYDGTNQFPSVTDVSDNVSYFPNKEKSGGSGGNMWREESVVIKHDPNESKIKIPQAKKYEPKIDEQIWADMMKVRNKVKQVT